ncbi:MAG: type IV pilus modification PilV family protein [Longimicrobiales bacterium]|jgi:Tfp pilus assembly protein PilV
MGFTIVEVVIALLFMTVVALSFAASNQFSARLQGRSEIELRAAQHLEAEVERLRALSLDSLSTGSRSSGLGQASWDVVDSTTFVQIILATEYGNASMGTVLDSVTIYRLR